MVKLNLEGRRMNDPYFEGEVSGPTIAEIVAIGSVSLNREVPEEAIQVLQDQFHDEDIELSLRRHNEDRQLGIPNLAQIASLALVQCLQYAYLVTEGDQTAAEIRAIRAQQAVDIEASGIRIGKSLFSS